MSLIMALGITNVAQAQVNVNVNLNSQPAWGPTGYDNANYYYFPSLNVYFDVNNSLFYYLSGSKWKSDRYLPSQYSNDDLYNTYKVVINDNKTPWKSNSQHQKNYSQYKSNNKQEAIRNSSDSRYSQSKKNTIAWVKDSDKNSSNNNSGKRQKNNKELSNNKNQEKDNSGRSNKR